MRIQICLFLAMFIPGCLGVSHAETTTRLDRALQLAGANAPEITQFLQPLKGEKRKAAELLVGFMSAGDLASFTASFLTTNLELAWQARTEFPWAKAVPLPLFVHYVLPCRLTQERVVPWREFLHARLKPYLQGCTNLVDAALATNRWCAAMVRFKQSEFRDKSPLATLKSGEGRCEELAGLAIAALRSAGIPARYCYTPWWAVSENNHAWVEVWAGEGWHYLGGCEGSKALNRTWFSRPAQRAGLVVSSVYGVPGEYDTGDLICKRSRNSAKINSTGVYAATGTLALSITDAKGKPAAGVPFAVSVYNWGAPRALTMRKTDATGRARVVLGMGEFLVSAGNEEASAFAVVSIRPQALNKVELQLKEGLNFPDSICLHFPTPAEANRAFCAQGGGGKLKAEFRPAKPKKPAPDRFAVGRNQALDNLLKGNPAASGLQKVLTKARGNWREIARALLALGQKRLALAQALLVSLPQLDLYELKSQMVVDHVLGAEQYQGRKMFKGNILKPLIYYRQHLSAWRQPLAKQFGSLAEKPAVQVAREIKAWVGKNLSAHEPGGRMGSFMGPVQVLKSRHASVTARRVFMAAALRSLGIPARIERVSNQLQFHDENGWQILAGSKSASKGKATQQVKKAHLAVERKRKGKIILSTNTIALSRFSDGALRSLRGAKAKPDKGALHYNLPPGRYVLTTGFRNPNGDAFVKGQVLELVAGEEMKVAINLEFPGQEGIFKFPKARKLQATPAGVAKSPLLVYFLAPAHEPSERSRAQVREAFPTLVQKGTRGLCLFLGGNDDPLPTMPFPTRRCTRAEAAKYGIKDLSVQLPSILLLQKGGKVILWHEGYEPKLGQLLKQAARQIK